MKTILLSLSLMSVVGCVSEHFKAGDVQVDVNRAFWQTGRYTATIPTANGFATITADNSKTDSEGLGTLVGTAIKASK